MIDLLAVAVIAVILMMLPAAVRDLVAMRRAVRLYRVLRDTYND